MPLYKTIKPNHKTTILVWKIEEHFDFLENITLNSTSLDRLSRMKSNSHKKGFLSIRHLLSLLNYTDDDLFYTANGKPHLKDGKSISITHSFNFSAIIVSDAIVGIDIEKNREKIIRIADKFIGKEIDYIDETEQEKLVIRLTQIWGAKESLYKIYPQTGLSFKKHLHILKYKHEATHTTGEIRIGNYYKVFRVSFVPVENFTLVYATNYS